MKRILSVLLSLSMIIAIFSAAPIYSLADESTTYFNLPLDCEVPLETGDYAYVDKFHFFAEKDGIYSITKRTQEGTAYLNPMSSELLTDDYRPTDDAQIYYYKFLLLIK